jgi:hypothetical protein
VGFSSITLPGGTSTASGQMTVNGLATTCTVACHSPFGGAPTTVAWNTPGPLACTACHQEGTQTWAGGSGHPVDLSSPANNRAACQTCHAFDQHTSGHVRIAVAGGAIVDVGPGTYDAVNAACIGCHGGSGTPLAGATPPLLVGWTSPGGDFHGSRAGTGYGGTLASPFQRGQAPLACVECHDPHVSGNRYLFTQAANGTPVAPTTIDQHGIGAEALCNGCHLGERHGKCRSCHESWTTTLSGDPMPPGSACFLCHGHEGIVNFPYPDPNVIHANGTGTGGDCTHCHVDWLLPFTASPPQVSQVAVTNLSPTSATVAWQTNVAATSYVEWGVGTAGATAGAYALGNQHTVALGPLTGLTTYTYRIRSVDAFRNVTETAPATFRTPSASAPPAPTLHPIGDIWTWNDVENVPLTWNAVVSPTNDPVQYQVLVAGDSGFTQIVAASGWISGTSFSASLAAWWYPGPYYFWEVQARDALTGDLSPWSNPSGFGVWVMY